MSRGVIPPSYRCTECHLVVFGSDASIYEGMHFHDHCLPSYLAKQEAVYEKKGRLGKLTVAENIEYVDVRGVNIKVRKAPKEPDLEKTFFPDTPRFKGNSRLSIESIRTKSLRSMEEMKTLGMSRREYVLFCSDRNEKRKLKYLTEDKKLLPAGDILTCQFCGRRTFLFEGKCQECTDKSEHKYITAGETFEKY